MTATAEKYREFWSDKTTPLGRGDSAQFLRMVAGELKLLFGERQPVSVLEIGCGNGCLFDFMDFSPRGYRGVDFGPRMLQVFRSNHPELDLVEAEASSYVDDRRYDLIFAHDVISHFDRSMLARHCRNAHSMMHSDSVLMWASVPWRALRHLYDLGLWSNGGEASVSRWAKGQISRIVKGDRTGYWYQKEEITAIAKRNSLQAAFYGSITHPYRFHAVLRPARTSILAE